MGYHLEDILGGRFVDSSGIRRDVVEIKTGGMVVWPLQPSITLGNVVAIFSAGTVLYANAANYVTLRATLRTRQGEYTVDIIPDAMPSDYFTVSNSHIVTNKAKYGKTEYSNISGSLSGYYQTAEGVIVRPSFGATSVTVSLQNNVDTKTSINDSYAISISSGVDAKGGIRTVSGTLTYHWHHSFTSGDYFDDSQVTKSQAPTSLTCPGTTVHNDKITFPVNRHSTSTKSYTAKGGYDGLYDSISITQDADYEYAGGSDTNYYSEISKTADNVWAGGGSGTISYSAYHIITTYYYWYSDDAYRRSGDSGQIADSASVEGSGTRFSRSGNTVTHQNMTTNEGTDSVTYICYNQSHRSTYDSVTFSATNSKGEGTPSTEYGSKTYGSSVWHYSDYTASLSASAYSDRNHPCPARGGSCTLTASGSHKEQEEKPYSRPAYDYLSGTYTSGSPYKDLQRTYTDTGSDWGAVTTKTDSPTPSVSGSGFTRSGMTVNIASEGTNPYADGRSATVSITNGDASQSISLYQQYNRKETPTISVSISLTADKSSVPASGGTVRVTVGIARTLNGQWTSTSPYTDHDTEGSVDLMQGVEEIGRYSHGGYADITVEPTQRTYVQTFTVNGTYVQDRRYTASVSYQQEAYVAPVITTSVDFLVVPQYGSGSFKLTTNKDWSIERDYPVCWLDGSGRSTDQAALTLSAYSGGAGERTITISRPTYTQGQVTCVRIRSGNISHDVIVLPSLNYSVNTSVWNPSGEAQSRRVVTNSDYLANEYSSDVSWCSGSGDNISVTANSGSARTGTISVRGRLQMTYFDTTNVDLSTSWYDISVQQAGVSYTISVNPTYVVLGLGETCQFGITTNAPSWSWSDSRNTMRQQAKTASTITLLLAATGYASGQDTIVTFTTPSGSTATATVHMK